MYIVTGKTGTPHVSGSDDAALNMAILGNGDYIWTKNNEFQIHAAGGSLHLDRAELIIQGVHSRIEGTETVDIDAGDQGMYRIDSVVAFYSLGNDGIEETGIKVISGTPSATLQNVREPELQVGDMYNFASYHESRIANVQIYENDIQFVTVVIPRAASLSQLESYVKQYESGETIPIPVLNTAGYITTDGKDICFSIPMSRPVSGRVVSVKEMQLTARHNGSYLAGSPYSYEDVTAKTRLYVGEGYISVIVRYDSAISGSINNTAVGITCRGSISIL